MPKAAREAEKLLAKYFPILSEVSLIPSTGGVFEVTVGGQLVFSKKALHRFPEEDELEKLLQEHTV